MVLYIGRKVIKLEFILERLVMKIKMLRLKVAAGITVPAFPSLLLPQSLCNQSRKIMTT
jgi:hypothetical protein